jgi:hypothetical protein
LEQGTYVLDDQPDENHELLLKIMPWARYLCKQFCLLMHRQKTTSNKLHIGRVKKELAFFIGSRHLISASTSSAQRTSNAALFRLLN